MSRQPAVPIGPAAPSRRAVGPVSPRSRGRLVWWGVVTPVIGIALAGILFCVALVAGMMIFYGGRIAPRVSVTGIDVGGQTLTEAALTLGGRWTLVTLRDEERVWQVNAASLGISLDAVATAQRAFSRSHVALSAAGWLSPLDVSPIVQVDENRMREALWELAPTLERAPVNAGVRLTGGRVEATPAQAGRQLAIQATLAQLRSGDALEDGVLDLAMAEVAPAIVDSSGMVAEAERLLANSLDIRVFDPVTGDSVHWIAPPETWGTWLTTAPDGGTATGLALAFQPEPVRAFVESQAAVLDSSRYLNVDEVIANLNANLAAGSPQGLARVYHHDGQHVVQSGETLISIAWDYGVPYPWIEQANPGLESVYPGQTIVIPSADNFFDFPPLPDKRIVVSISQQHVWVYENGALKWDWLTSTGIASSPTWPGIYQIILHEPNAYAANWNLYMPHFLGVYRPIPGADFTNGFHGFPTRGGSQLLWTNSLGTRVTYGCILLSNTNAELLYNWAENGVVVEIQA